MTRPRKLRAWPGTMRPVWVAAEYTGRSAETIRTWVKNGDLRSQHDPRTGGLLVDLVQATELDAAKPRRFRRLRTASPGRPREGTRVVG